MKKIVCTIIVLVYMLCLTGCNESNLLYKDISFNTEVDQCIIRDMIYSNDRVIIAADLYFEKEETYSYQSHAEILSCNIDGSDIQRIMLEEDLQETEVTSISRMILYEDGSTLAVQITHDVNMNQRTELKRRNEDGTLRWVKSTDVLKDTLGNDAYILDMFTDEEGNTYLLCSGSKTLLFFLDPNGNVTNSKVINYVDMSNLKKMLINKDKTFFIVTYNKDMTKWFASTYDPSTNTYGEKEEIPINLYGFQAIKGVSTDLILYDESGIYSYNLGDTELKPIMNSIESNLEVFYFMNVVMIDNNGFAVAYKDFNDKPHIGIFTKNK